MLWKEYLRNFIQTPQLHKNQNQHFEERGTKVGNYIYFPWI